MDIGMKLQSALLSVFIILSTINPASAFLREIHVNITEDALALEDFSEDAIGEVTSSNKGTDIREFFVSHAHFDNETFLRSNNRIIRFKEHIITEIIKPSASTENEGKAARKTLGRAIHTLQDYYSHSNWVERNIENGQGQNINSLLGAVDSSGNPLLPPRGSNPAPQNTPLCEPINNPVGDQLLDDGRIYSTTGHFSVSTICSARPAGRCLHGNNSIIPSRNCEGLHKDHAQRPGFVPARDLAIEATVVFVRQILADERVTDNDKAIQVLLDQQGFVYDLEIIRDDGLVITQDFVNQEDGMVISLGAPNGDFTHGESRPGVWGGVAPADLEFDPETGRWKLTVPEEVTAEELWVTVWGVQQSADTQHPNIYVRSEMEQTQHLIAPGSYTINIPLNDPGTRQIPSITSSEFLLELPGVRISKPYRASYKASTFGGGDDVSILNDNNILRVTIENGRNLPDFVENGSFRKEARIITTRNGHIEPRTLFLRITILDSDYEFAREHRFGSINTIFRGPGIDTVFFGNHVIASLLR